MDIEPWLDGLGLERYTQSFADNDIDASMLPRLTDADLKELGVRSLGHRKRLLAAIAQLTCAGGAEVSVRAVGTPADERRQVAVLFADLCGFTDLSRKLDPEELLVVLDGYFEQVDAIVERHGGHIDKHVGDCVMAVFGAPRSHGNDPERAVRAALAMIDAIPALSRTLARPLSIHVGIAVGQVVASGMGSTAHREYTVTGDTVNLASRLTDAAGPGEILISEAVWRALADRLDCAARGALAVKGFAEPVSVWRLDGLRRSAPSRPLIGRLDELSRFRDILRSCREAARGGIVQIRGEAGIGKTRLAEAFQREATERGFACHHAFVLDFGSGAGRDAIRSLVRGLLALDDSSNADAATLAVTRAIADGLIDAGDAPFVDDLIDVPQPPEGRAVYEAMNHAMRVRGRQNAMIRLMQSASRKQPRLLVVEDIHWSDRSTRQDLTELASAAAESPAVLVLTTRPRDDPLDNASNAACSFFDLGPLNDSDARLMAGSFPCADELAERCIERAAGNPLFLEQLLSNAEKTANAGVPGSVQSLVQARLDGLDPVEKNVLRVASIFGQFFEKEAVGHMLDGAAPALEPLITGRLLRQQGSGYSFHHALIRDAIYDGLLKSQRRELHRRAAQWYAQRDAVLRAEHLDRAADVEAPRAYCDAAQTQAAGYRYEFALRLVERGLELTSAQSDRVALECLRGDILHDTGDMPAALGAFETALAAAATDTERCQAWIGRATVKRIVDDLDGAWADLDCAAAAATADGLLREQARIHFLRGNLCFPRGEIDGCVREHERSLAIAREARDFEQEAAALGGLGDGEYMRGRMISAHHAFSRCIDLCRLHGFGRIEVANLPMLAITAWFAGKTNMAVDTAHASIAAAEKVGHLRALAVAHHAAWHCFHDLAQWDRAWEHVGPALQCARDLKSRRFEGEALALRAELQRVAGRRREALDDIGEALAISRETGMAYLGAAYLGTLARVTHERAVFERAIEEGEAVLAAGAVSHNHYLFRRDAIEACLDRGQWDAAAVHAAALERYVCREPSPFSGFVLARARVLIAHGRGKRSAAASGELRRIREEGAALGFLYALSAIDAALADHANQTGPAT
ncbi:AAA family ATPase [Paraburkholderia sp. Tr-20389]|uniref:adenylate/guanylate cyclase domain-containing protein n=1 Tax=Paraburkholderia sp. Tr-20389 TaxID=2703903 RepID=UPI00198140FA|nr:adenylate/guanylate cyclase domain-containing protein [Paraburkholderia sp. Tr-20389]MBN3754448.1 AAA family ATPase [Paraburkholderia sp. Tr-20389]